MEGSKKAKFDDHQTSPPGAPLLGLNEAVFDDYQTSTAGTFQAGPPMVEAGGIEPPSVSPRLQDLRT